MRSIRLTLRTLLAYLDDRLGKSLEPDDVAEFQRRVEESEQARELVARIRDLISRPLVGTPLLDGRGLGNDANSVAEYLDNKMKSKRTEELEKLCLISDMHLAEVAACHQILSQLDDGAPSVPKAFRERLYGIEAISAELAEAEATAARLQADQTDTASGGSPPVDAPPVDPSGRTGAVAGAVVAPPVAEGSVDPATVGDLRSSRARSGAAPVGAEGSDLVDSARTAKSGGGRLSWGVATLTSLAALVLLGIVVWQNWFDGPSLAQTRPDTTDTDPSPGPSSTRGEMIPLVTPPPIDSAASPTPAEAGPDRPPTGRETDPEGSPGPSGVAGVNAETPAERAVTGDEAAAARPSDSGELESSSPPAISTGDASAGAPTAGEAMSSGEVPPGVTSAPAPVGAPAPGAGPVPDAGDMPFGTVDPVLPPPGALASSEAAAPMTEPPVPGLEGAAPADPSAPEAVAPPAESTTPAPVAVPGSLIVTEQPKSILIARPATGDEWVRASDKSLVAAGSDVVVPPNARVAASLSTDRTIDLVGPVRMATQVTESGATRLDVALGRMVIASEGEASPLRLGWPGHEVTVIGADGAASLLLDATTVPVEGADLRSTPGMGKVTLSAYRGRLLVRDGDRETTLEPGRFITYHGDAATDGRWAERGGAIDWPAWVDAPAAEEGNAPIDRLAKALAPGRPVWVTLTELAGEKIVPYVALVGQTQALMGNFDSVVRSWTVADQKAFWQPNWQLARALAASDPVRAGAFVDSVERVIPVHRERIIRLLGGVAPKQLSTGGAAALVGLLEDDEMAVRVAALLTLQEITGLTYQYRPDYAQARLRASALGTWKTTLKNGTIRWAKPPLRAVETDFVSFDGPALPPREADAAE